MKTPLDRLVAAFALFFTAALPLLAGFIGKQCHRFLVDLVGRTATGPQPALTRLFYDNFGALLWGLFLVALLLVVLGALQTRVADPVVRLGRVLLFTVLSATISVVFLGLFLLATTLPYAIPG